MSLQENGAPAPKKSKSKRAKASPPTAGAVDVAPAFPTAAPTGVFLVPLEDLRESPTNPRKTFDAAALDELAKSVKRHGVLEPVLVREVPDPEGTDKAPQYELVFGARRYRAARLAELDVLPCMVRDLTDEQVLEIQIVENAKRADIHPVEEAEGFKALHEQYGHSVDEIAAMVGKTKATVYARLKLCDLVPRAKKLGLEGKLTPSVLVLIARMPAKVQEEFLSQEAARYGRDEGGISAREAFHVIEGRYMLRLAAAPFDRGDEQLVPGAGACSACPKRTGNQRELFADVKSADVCTDPDCFTAKRDAHVRKALAAYAEKGTKILEGKKARDAVYGRSFIQLDKECYDDSKGRKYRTLLKGADLPVTVAVQTVKSWSGRGGGAEDHVELVELVDAKLAAPILRKAHVRSSADASRGSMNEQDKRRKAEAEAAAKRVKTYAIVGAVVAAAENKVPGGNFWPFLARLLAKEVGYVACTEILKRRGLAASKKNSGHGIDYRKAVARLVDDKKPDAARALAVELALGGGAWAFGTWCTKAVNESVLAAAKFYGVDAGKVGAAAMKKAEK